MGTLIMAPEVKLRVGDSACKKTLDTALFKMLIANINLSPLPSSGVTGAPDWSKRNPPGM
jgi:hypothetical protein